LCQETAAQTDDQSPQGKFLVPQADTSILIDAIAPQADASSPPADSSAPLSADGGALADPGAALADPGAALQSAVSAVSAVAKLGYTSNSDSVTGKVS
jgi:hypothetical protein